MPDERRDHEVGARGQPDRPQPRSEAGLRRAFALAEDVADAVTAANPDWPHIAAWAHELAQIAERRASAAAQRVRPNGPKGD
jgi:hypothetical protein